MTWSTMSRRYTCNSEDYPEHLNPFHEDNEGDDARKNKFDTIGRRKLKTVLSLTSWTPFPTKKTKPADKDTTVFQRSKFLTMTPKISRGLMERLSQRTNRSKSSAPASNPVPSRDQITSYSDFKIMPRSSREKFAIKAERDERYDAETARYLWRDESSSPTSPGADVASSSTSTTPISEVHEDHDPSEESKPAKRGARARKKRRAPLPPPQPMSETQADDKQDNTSAEMEEPPVSLVPVSTEPPLLLSSVSESPEPPLSLPSVSELSEPPQPLSSVGLPESPEPPQSLSLSSVGLPESAEPPQSLSLSSVGLPESAEPPLSPVSESPELPLSLPQSLSSVGLPESPEPPLCSVPDSSPESNGNINLTTTETQPDTGIGIQVEETLPTSRC